MVTDVKLLHYRDWKFNPPHCQPGEPLASPVFQNAGAVAHFWRPTAVNTAFEVEGAYHTCFHLMKDKGVHLYFSEV